MPLVRAVTMRRMKRHAFLLAWALVAATAGAPDARAASVQPAPVAAANQATAAFLAAEMRLRRIPGLQVAVVKDGRTIFEGAWGVADIENRAPVTTGTVFPLNSMTKAFTGVAAMQLVAAGRLNLSAPIARYLPDLPSEWRSVTVRQLLTHMSGLPDIVDPDSGALIGDGSEAAAWSAVRAKPMDFAPGQDSRYNQTNYVLLGRMIDRLAAQPFGQFFAARQWAPAGMRRTGFGDIHDWKPGKAKSYRYDAPTLDSPGTLVRADVAFAPLTRTAAGMESTAGDMARWFAALLDGRLIARSALPTLWETGVLPDGTRTERALGWASDNRAVNHWVGQTGGDRGAFAIYPDDGVAVIILTNLRGASPEQLLDQVAANYIPGFVLPGPTRLRAALQARGFDKAAAIAAELRRADPAIAFPQREMSDWGYRLLRTAQPREALAVFELIVSLYPGSAAAAENLGYTHHVMGNIAGAVVQYKRAVALNPADANLVRTLQSLESAANQD
jgi:CubicO group peptidase (beta-lactamase class C family)